VEWHNRALGNIGADAQKERPLGEDPLYIIFGILITRNEFVFLSHPKPQNRPVPTSNSANAHIVDTAKKRVLNHLQHSNVSFLNFFLLTGVEPRVSAGPDWVCILLKRIRTICLYMPNFLVILVAV
jgi:hypothetical protein